MSHTGWNRCPRLTCADATFLPTDSAENFPIPDADAIIVLTLEKLAIVTFREPFGRLIINIHGNGWHHLTAQYNFNNTDKSH
jgi:hypothetical protein